MPHLPYVHVDFGPKQVLGLVDSGATQSIIHQDLFEIMKRHKLVKRVQLIKINSLMPTKQGIAIICCVMIKIKITYY